MDTTLDKLGSGDRRLDGRSTRDSRLNLLVRYLKLIRYKRAVAKGYDAAAPYYDAWEWQALWRITEWPQLRSLLTSPKRVLEIGIGTGAVAERILNEVTSVERYVGIDLSERMLSQCQHRLLPRSDAEIELIHEDVVRVDFAKLGGPFDFVLSCRMIGHLQSPTEMFEKVRSVIAPGGLFVVTDLDVNHGYTVTRLPTQDGRVEVPTFKHRQEDVIAAAEKAGLRLDRFYRTYEDEARANAGAKAPHSLAGRDGPLFNLFVFRAGPALPA